MPTIPTIDHKVKVKVKDRDRDGEARVKEDEVVDSKYRDKANEGEVGERLGVELGHLGEVHL
jgi:hypothetical protein